MQTSKGREGYRGTTKVPALLQYCISAMKQVEEGGICRTNLTHVYTRPSSNASNFEQFLSVQDLLQTPDLQWCHSKLDPSIQHGPRGVYCALHFHHDSRARSPLKPTAPHLAPQISSTSCVNTETSFAQDEPSMLLGMFHLHKRVSNVHLRPIPPPLLTYLNIPFALD